MTRTFFSTPELENGMKTLLNIPKHEVNMLVFRVSEAVADPSSEHRVSFTDNGDDSCIVLTHTGHIRFNEETDEGDGFFEFKPSVSENEDGFEYDEFIDNLCQTIVQGIKRDCVNSIANIGTICADLYTKIVTSMETETPFFDVDIANAATRKILEARMVGKDFDAPEYEGTDNDDLRVVSEQVIYTHESNLWSLIYATDYGFYLKYNAIMPSSVFTMLDDGLVKKLKSLGCEKMMYRIMSSIMGFVVSINDEQLVEKATNAFLADENVSVLWTGMKKDLRGHDVVSTLTLNNRGLVPNLNISSSASYDFIRSSSYVFRAISAVFTNTPFDFQFTPCFHGFHGSTHMTTTFNKLMNEHPTR